MPEARKVVVESAHTPLGHDRILVCGCAPIDKFMLTSVYRLSCSQAWIWLLVKTWGRALFMYMTISHFDSIYTNDFANIEHCCKYYIKRWQNAFASIKPTFANPIRSSQPCARLSHAKSSHPYLFHSPGGATAPLWGMCGCAPLCGCAPSSYFYWHS